MLSLALLGLCLAACAPKLPQPRGALHGGADPEVVPYPPPVARAEFVPARPNAEAVWVDGQWQWTGAGYAWGDGRWQQPPDSGRYAPPVTVRRSNGQLLYYEGRWIGDEGK